MRRGKLSEKVSRTNVSKFGSLGECDGADFTGKVCGPLLNLRDCSCGDLADSPVFAGGEGLSDADVVSLSSEKSSSISSGRRPFLPAFKW